LGDGADKTLNPETDERTSGRQARTKEQRKQDDELSMT
jgi:hypothetical protein